MVQLQPRTDKGQSTCANSLQIKVVMVWLITNNGKGQTLVTLGTSNEFGDGTGYNQEFGKGQTLVQLGSTDTW